MSPSPSPRDPTSRHVPLNRILTWWFGLMGIGGLAFGAYADRQPFGADILAQPLVVFFAVAGLGLLIFRFALRRPVPEVISERMLFVDCAVGAVAFLVGNWFATHLVALP